MAIILPMIVNLPRNCWTVYNQNVQEQCQYITAALGTGIVFLIIGTNIGRLHNVTYMACMLQSNSVRLV